MKICKGCGKTKPLTAFPTAKRNTDGRHGKCRTCRNAAVRAAYWEKKDPTPRDGQRIEINDDGRYCKRCDQWKPWSAYGLHRIGPYGRQSTCRSCRSELRTAR